MLSFSGVFLLAFVTSVDITQFFQLTIYKNSPQISKMTGH